MKGPLFVILALGISAAAAAMDFGLAANFRPAYDTAAGEGVFSLTNTYVPWFSTSIRENIGLYISARFGFEGERWNNRWNNDVVYELDRTELTVRLAETIYLTLGRQWYQDNSGLIAAGLFDGLYGSFGLGPVRLTGGVFSTALLHKKTADIRMTDGDVMNYWDSDKYFSSNRLFAVLGGEFPDLTLRTSLQVSALAQFDLNDYDEYGESQNLDSQYLTAKFRVEVLDTLRLGITGIAAAAEFDRDIRGSFAGILEMDWDVPGNLADMFIGELQWGTGAVNDDIGPFTPINRITRGLVFTPNLPGLMSARASYAVRLRRTLSLNAASAVFFRTDVETFDDSELDPASRNRHLGTEFYGQMTWMIQSPLRITMGAGAFLPGAAFIKDADLRWKINMGLTFSL
jgi:hypothetical protein